MIPKETLYAKCIVCARHIKVLKFLDLRNHLRSWMTQGSVRHQARESKGQRSRVGMQVRYDNLWNLQGCLYKGLSRFASERSSLDDLHEPAINRKALKDWFS